MPINRREFIKTTAAGTATLAMTPLFSHLLAAPEQAAPNDAPHRFVFIRKSNGNLTSQFGLPSFSAEQVKMHKEKQAFEVDRGPLDIAQHVTSGLERAHAAGV